MNTYQQSCGKVMFSQVSVCHSVQGGKKPHVTITYDALDITGQDPQPGPHPLQT